MKAKDLLDQINFIVENLLIDILISSLRYVWFFIRNSRQKILPNVILKNLCEEMYSLITEACIKHSYFPNSFKCAKVVPILKKGKENKLACSYRPISLLSCLGKIWEKVLVKRINEFTEENNVINKEQYGFRKEHSTIYQPKRLVNIIQKEEALELSY